MLYALAPFVTLTLYIVYVKSIDVMVLLTPIGSVFIVWAMQFVYERSKEWQRVVYVGFWFLLYVLVLLLPRDDSTVETRRNFFLYNMILMLYYPIFFTCLFSS